MRGSNDTKTLLAYSILKGACKPRAKENCLSYVATKLPGMPETHDKEKSNGNGSLSVREVRLERLDRFKFYSRGPSDCADPTVLLPAAAHKGMTATWHLQKKDTETHLSGLELGSVACDS